MAEAASVDKKKSRERGIDDYKRKIWKLKKEIDDSKVLKEAELQALRDELENKFGEDRDAAILALKQEARTDLLEMHSKFNTRETELSELLKSREAEMDRLRSTMSSHKQEVRSVKEALEAAHTDLIGKLQKEIRQVKTQNTDLQQRFQAKQQELKDKTLDLKHLQEESERERQKLMNEAVSAKLRRHESSGISGPSSYREKELSNRNRELQLKLDRLEKRTSLLKDENTTLKKKESLVHSLEEEIAKLKRRNNDLSTNSKGPSDKHKSDPKKGGEPEANSTQALDQARKLFARQRAKDFAEHSKVLLHKDREIEQLTKKSVSLADQLINGSRDQIYREHMDMAAVLTQTSKEKLTLELHSQGIQGDNEDMVSKTELFNLQCDYDSLQQRLDETGTEKANLENCTRELKEENQGLQLQLDDMAAGKQTFEDRIRTLEEELRKHQRLKSEHAQLEQNHRILMRKQDEAQAQVTQLEYQCEESAKKETDNERRSETLTVRNDQLTNQIVILKTEMSDLRCTKIRPLEEDNASLQKKIQDLKTQRESINSEQKLDIDLLKSQIDNLLTQLKQSESDKQSLEKQLEATAEHHESEILILKQEAKSTAQQLEGTQSKLALTEDHLREAESRLTNDTTVSTLQHQHGEYIEQKTAEIQTLKEQLESLERQFQVSSEKHEQLKSGMKLEQEILKTELADAKERYTNELNILDSQVSELQTLLASTQENLKSSLKNVESLEQKLSEREDVLQVRIDESSDLEIEISSLRSELKALQAEFDQLREKCSGCETEKAALQAEITRLQNDHEVISNLQSELEAAQEELVEQNKELVEGQREKEDREIEREKKTEQLVLFHNQAVEIFKEDLQMSLQEKTALEERMNHLELELSTHSCEPNKKPINVYAGDVVYHLYVARNSYDPSLSLTNGEMNSSFDQSGDDSCLTSSERLQPIIVNAGDYVFLNTQISEDGYYEGRLLDGRFGLIPSNILDPLYEFDMEGFVLASKPMSADSTPPDHVTGSFAAPSIKSSPPPRDVSVLPSAAPHTIPFPTNLTLERQFSNSILVGWKAPKTLETINKYNIHIDGDIRATVNSDTKLSGLADSVKAIKKHRVAVTAETDDGSSDWRHCTMMIGCPDGPPTDITVEHSNEGVMVVTFTPHSSNYRHRLYVDKKTIRTLKPHTFQVHLSRLPSGTHELIVETLPAEAGSKRRDSLCARIQFEIPADQIGDPSEPEFLKKFSPSGDSSEPPPTPPTERVPEFESGDLEFLEQYDSTLPPETTQPQINQTIQVKHSTPYGGQLKLLPNQQPAQGISPIVLNDSSHHPSNQHQCNVGAEDESQAKIDSRISTQIAVLSQSNQSDELRRPASQSDDSRRPVSQSDDPMSDSVKSERSRRASPLQNKQSLQKMLKSLAKEQRSKTSGAVKAIIPDDKSSSDVSMPSPEHRTVSTPKSARRSRKPMVVARYDYDPAVMSPNADASQELKFKLGDIISVLSEVDHDGFYMGELNGRQGYVPSNLVESIKPSVLRSRTRSANSDLNAKRNLTSQTME